MWNLFIVIRDNNKYKLDSKHYPCVIPIVLTELLIKEEVLHYWGNRSKKCNFALIGLTLTH